MRQLNEAAESGMCRMRGRRTEDTSRGGDGQSDRRRILNPIWDTDKYGPSPQPRESCIWDEILLVYILTYTYIIHTTSSYSTYKIRARILLNIRSMTCVNGMHILKASTFYVCMCQGYESFDSIRSFYASHPRAGGRRWLPVIGVIVIVYILLE